MNGSDGGLGGRLLQRRRYWKGLGAWRA
ncbi:hypothetical protein LINPERPRIM_LOCUS15326 [Linum perenne]